jgi:hypothetical protein
MTFSISALVLARDSHIKPDSEAGGLINVSGGYLPSGQISVICPHKYRICPHISVFAPVFNFRYLRSGLKDYMSKLQGKMMHKDMHKIVFQSN